MNQKILNSALQNVADNILSRVNLENIYADANHISQFVHKTPLVRLPWLDAPNRTVWAKLECNQLTNSFKVRGAFNAIRKINPNTTVVTASAGNHGLAIAYVAEKLGRKSKIFVPANASEIKLRRLISMGAEVSPVGKDLHESTKIAQAVANDINGSFISPFSHPDVILGQGSLAVEVSNQKDFFDQILVPLGGGGLLIGSSLVFKDKFDKCQVRAIHPKVFQRQFNKDFYEGLSKPVYPSIADGLAVQHSANDHTASLVQKTADIVDLVPEQDIELGVVATLNNEGLLVEGAGAIGVAALINDPEGDQYKGDVLTLVCGGNIATSSLMHALATHTDSPRLGKLLGHRSVPLPLEAVKHKSAVSKKTDSHIIQEDKKIPARNIWPELLDTVEEDIKVFAKDLKRHKEHIVGEGLNYDAKTIKHLQDEIASAQKLVKLGKDGETRNWVQRDIFRLLIQQYSFIRNSLSWCSASSDQTGRVMFFDPAENSSGSVNYDRYGSLLLREREFKMQQALGFDVEKTDLLLTSSGQAAYNVIESFLLRKGMSKNPTVVSAPYIYFEALEQIQELRHVDFITSQSWDIRDLIKLTEEKSAEVLFVDPLANLGTLHAIDFTKFAKELDGRNWSNKHLVVDGTMVSGGINLFEIFNKPNHPNVLYYESGSKYLQLGLDLQMAGIVVCAKEYGSELTKHRRNTGSIMYQSSVTKLPRYDRSHFLTRMGHLTRNAEALSNHLKTFDPNSKKIGITYPHNWRSLGWAHGGGIVSITMKDKGLNNRACLDYLIDMTMKECASEGVSLTKGVSFGFATTRISAAAAMAHSRPPFLRFSVGEETPLNMKKICKASTRALKKFFYHYQPS